MTMIERKLDALSQSAQSYFDFLDCGTTTIGEPYLLEEPKSIPTTDYMGLIETSGDYASVCGFSANSEVLESVLNTLGIEDRSEDMLLDVIGEMTNAMLGNVGQYLTGKYDISTPQVARGELPNDYLVDHSTAYIIPIDISGNTAKLHVFMRH